MERLCSAAEPPSWLVVVRSSLVLARSSPSEPVVSWPEPQSSTPAVPTRRPPSRRRPAPWWARSTVSRRRARLARRRPWRAPSRAPRRTQPEGAERPRSPRSRGTADVVARGEERCSAWSWRLRRACYAVPQGGPRDVGIALVGRRRSRRWNQPGAVDGLAPVHVTSCPCAGGSDARAMDRVRERAREEPCAGS